MIRSILSTGFSTVTYDRWFDQKHGKLHAQHAWVKLHVMVGTVTHAVFADKEYGSVDNHEVLDRLGVAAYIPFKENAVINPKSPAW